MTKDKPMPPEHEAEIEQELDGNAVPADPMPPDVRAWLDKWLKQPAGGSE